MSRSKRGSLAGVLILAALVALPAGAQAASVRVEELQTASGTAATLDFEAAPGEANHLTISVASEDASFFHLELLETGAALKPGAGCSGGGSPGVAVSCTIHKPRGGETEKCHDCYLIIPGTAWRTAFIASLGNGGSYFNAAGIPDVGPLTVPMKLTGGSGNDFIATAGGDDQIDPGPGSDHVVANAGGDMVATTAAPDGADIYELGTGIVNTVDYGQRTVPISYDANSGLGGAAGEEDRISGATTILGGSGDDTFVGGPTSESFLGFGGDDRLGGGGGNDRLEGGPGANQLEGDEGNDKLVVEVANGAPNRAAGGPGNDAIALGAGADLASGDEGDDKIRLGGGDDLGYGGTGNDEIYGEGGDDRLWGNGGSNSLIGGFGSDALTAGTGGDTILAGTDTKSITSNFDHPPGALDSWSDVINCGGRPARVSLNPWDQARGCKRTSLVRAVDLKQTIIRRQAGTAILQAEVRGAGRLRLYGHGVHPVLVSAAGKTWPKSPLRIAVKPRDAALRTLRRSGQVKLAVKLRFQEPGGLPRIRSATVRLQLRPMPAARG